MLPRKVVTQLQEMGANESLHGRRGSLIHPKELTNLDVSRERRERGEGRVERCCNGRRDDATRLMAMQGGGHPRARDQGMRRGIGCRPGVGLVGKAVRLEGSLGRGSGEKRVPRG